MGVVETWVAVLCIAVICACWTGLMLIEASSAGWLEHVGKRRRRRRAVR